MVKPTLAPAQLMSDTPLALGVDLGTATAPRRILAFLNIACPDCKKWFERNLDYMKRAANHQDIYVQLLFWNKPNLDLTNGNVAQHYFNVNEDSNLTLVQELFGAQDALKALGDEAEVVAFLKNRFGLQRQFDQYALDQINVLANDVVASVPTIVTANQVVADSDSLLTDLLNFEN